MVTIDKQHSLIGQQMIALLRARKNGELPVQTQRLVVEPSLVETAPERLQSARAPRGAASPA